MRNLASNLSGIVINGWTVLDKLSKVGTSGGAFSSGYKVKHADGRIAFMKAVNIGYAMTMFMRPGTSRNDVLNEITERFKHERTLLEACKEKRLDRIVVPIESGEYDDPAYDYFVPYLIFEYCEGGDIRRQTSKMSAPGLEWRLRVFHGVCVGLQQLHRNGISHQDLKPSNVLITESDFSKIADLGCATTGQPNTMFSTPNHWGDDGYCPIEYRYNYFLPDSKSRQRAGDFYMLGGILTFLISNINVFAQVIHDLPPAFYPRAWTRNYSDALPALRSSTYSVVDKIIATSPGSLRPAIKEMLLWLCEPDPSARGHPDTVTQAFGDRYSLERIISAADVLAKKARIAK